MTYHVKRADKEISDPDEVRRVLKAAKYMTLAMVRDGDPYLVSLSTGYDEDRNTLCFHCAVEGKKLDYMRANPNVWGQVLLDHGYAEGECTQRYVAVMFRGRVGFLDSLEDKRRALATMMNQLDPDPHRLLGRLINSEGLAATVVGEVELLEVTGKKTQGLQQF